MVDAAENRRSCALVQPACNADDAVFRSFPALSTLPPAPHQAFELRLWPDQHPLRQFEQQLSFELLRKLEDRNLTLDMLAVS